MNPLKAYAYLAAGLPIVATGVSNLDELEPFIRRADNPEAFVAAVERCLSEGSEDLSEARRAVLDQVSWEHRIEVMLKALEPLLEAGVNVVSIAEEMAWPWAYSREQASRVDALARANGVSVLGTGVNPGFVLDLLVVALTGVCARVDAITARRVNDLAPSQPTERALLQHAQQLGLQVLVHLGDLGFDGSAEHDATGVSLCSVRGHGGAVLVPRGGRFLVYVADVQHLLARDDLGLDDTLPLLIGPLAVPSGNALLEVLHQPRGHPVADAIVCEDEQVGAVAVGDRVGDLVGKGVVGDRYELYVQVAS